MLWYENIDGSATFSSSNTISTSLSFANSSFAIDLDADGDNDVLAVSYNGNEVIWYENVGSETINPPNITLNANALNSNIPPILIPNNAGGYVDTWSITPTLNGTPSFNTSSGALYGTYTPGATGDDIMTVEHRITATNAGGSDTIVLDINRPTTP